MYYFHIPPLKIRSCCPAKITDNVQRTLALLGITCGSVRILKAKLITSAF